MKEYVFLRINDKFRDLFANQNLSSFLELYNRREESVFYKEQFRLFLEKNKQKEIIAYLKEKLDNRNDLTIENNKLILRNSYNENNEVLELRDNFLIINGDFDKSVFAKYLSEYDSDFLRIDLNNNKIQRLILVN